MVRVDFFGIRKRAGYWSLGSLPSNAGIFSCVECGVMGWFEPTNIELAI